MPCAYALHAMLLQLFILGGQNATTAVASVTSNAPCRELCHCCYPLRRAVGVQEADIKYIDPTYLIRVSNLPMQGRLNASLLVFLTQSQGGSSCKIAMFWLTDCPSNLECLGNCPKMWQVTGWWLQAVHTNSTDRIYCKVCPHTHTCMHALPCR